jgi:hypothetical protein
MSMMFWKAGVFLIGLFLLAGCAARAPKLEVVPIYDLGTVAKGDTAVAELPVRNGGGAPLLVEAVTTSCGCTQAGLSTMTIAPGAEAILRVAYDSGVHESDEGEMERYVFILSNDPAQPDMKIRFTARVER